MHLFYLICYYLFRWYISIFHWNKICGVENIPKGAAILAPNHASFFDPPIVGASCPEVLYFLGHESLFDKWILSRIIRNLNTFPVKGTARDLTSLKLISKLLREGKKVVIFPEGERSRTGEFLPIKPGAAMLAMRNKVPIIPVYLHGTFHVWPRNRTLPKLWGRIACVFGKPIPYQKFEHLDKKEAQEAMGESIEQALTKLKEWYDSGAKGVPP